MPLKRGPQKEAVVAGGPDSFSDLFTSKVTGATGQMKRGDAFEQIRL